MTFARSRIDSHNAGTCDPRTCPVCLDERADAEVSTHSVWSSEPCDCLDVNDHDAGQEVRP